MSAVDENGEYQVDKLNAGDIWYFPKGSAHTIQGLNEPLADRVLLTIIHRIGRRE